MDRGEDRTKRKIEKIINRIIIGVVILIISSISLGAIVQPALDDMQQERDEKIGKVDYPDATFWDRGEPRELWPQWKEDDYQRLTAIRIINILIIAIAIAIIVASIILYFLKYLQIQQTPPPQPTQPQPQYSRQQPIPQPTQRGEIRLCKSCHAKLDFNWISCPYCGQPI